MLRMPAETVGIWSKEEWDQFEWDYRDVLRWDPGFFAPSLSTTRLGRFIDYYLADRVEVWGDGCDTYTRPLSDAEKEKYLPVFQKMFPGFTMEQMEAVHYCEYTWYDGTEAPYCY